MVTSAVNAGHRETYHVLEEFVSSLSFHLTDSSETDANRFPNCLYKFIDIASRIFIFIDSQIFQVYFTR